jgi:hypothetical protein
VQPSGKCEHPFHLISSNPLWRFNLADNGHVSPSIADDFAIGFCSYSDSHYGLKEPLARIYVPFRPEGAAISFMALLDTGGHFCILGADVVEEIKDRLTESFRETTLVTARGRVRGELFRHSIHLLAERGEDLTIEATILVSPDWQGPSVLGYTGMLDRMRFAIDTRLNQFYFGSHG